MALARLPALPPLMSLRRSRGQRAGPMGLIQGCVPGVASPEMPHGRHDRDRTSVGGASGAHRRCKANTGIGVDET